MLEPARIRSPRLRALLALSCTCALWGLSFSTMKALGLHLSNLDPKVSTWFVAAATLVVRFAASALLVGLRGLPRPTRAELQQGLWMGLFTGAGMLFQMDALSFTSASTSAFLTQGYVVILPIFSALAARRWPSLKIVICALTIAAGLGTLSGFDWVRLRLGRGETETLLAALCFAFQILLLDRRAFRGNRTGVVSVSMFACIALLLLPVAIWSARSSADMKLLAATPIAVALLFLLSVPSTTIAFSLMNRYQPELSASEAGIIYGAEPVFASILALFLPGILQAFAHVDYPNEVLGSRLLVGGGLVVIANVLLQLPFGARRPSEQEARELN
ncbi:MAG TPA: DMT family transporter [Polyangiaceae bacterium]|jgi:drug/metabolite transporter (DMT)-like permease|nr:DMT family transporter [Polyangiaceae bacterium]